MKVLFSKIKSVFNSKDLSKDNEIDMKIKQRIYSDENDFYEIIKKHCDNNLRVSPTILLYLLEKATIISQLYLTINTCENKNENYNDQIFLWLNIKNHIVEDINQFFNPNARICIKGVVEIIEKEKGYHV